MDENNNITSIPVLAEPHVAEGRVVKVLAIDMNFIMYNCIKLYFDNVNPDENASITWQDLEMRKDIDQFLNIDSTAYLNIVKMIKHNIDGAKKFSIVNSQKEIIDQLILDNDGIMYEIVNLDFYHDLFVDPKKDRQKLKHFNKFNDMNWVGYLDAKEKLFSYFWVSTPNSVVLPQIKFNTERIEHKSYYKLEKFLDFGFEEIYISKSPNMVPYKYRYLISVLEEAFKKNKEG